MSQAEMLRRRDPGEIYADLHEALRHDRVFHLAMDGSPSDHQKLDPQRPVYDFDDFLYHRNGAPSEHWEQDMTALLHRGDDLAKRQLLLAEPAAFLWSLATVDGDFGAGGYSRPWWLDRVVFVDPATINGEPGYTVVFFDRDRDIATGQINTYGPQRLVWCGLRAIILPEKPEPFAIEVRPGVFSPEMPPDLKVQLHGIYVAAAALAEEPSFITTEPSRQFAAMNHGRARGRLAPVPSVRVVDIHRKRYVAPHPATPTGREMPVHFRRGSFRTFRHPRYKNAQGKTIAIGSTWVRPDKADGELPAPALYVIKP